MEGQERAVCKVALAHIDGVTEKHLIRISTAYNDGLCAPTDKRGTHSTRPHALSETVLKQIDDHIQFFPAWESTHDMTMHIKYIYLPIFPYLLCMNYISRNMSLQFIMNLKLVWIQSHRLHIKHIELNLTPNLIYHLVIHYL